jgi:hypothetical protein
VKRATTVLRTKGNAPRVRLVMQSFRLSKLERMALRRASRGAGVSVSDYLRALLRQAPTYREHLADLGGLAVFHEKGERE